MRHVRWVTRAQINTVHTVIPENESRYREKDPVVSTYIALKSFSLLVLNERGSSLKLYGFKFDQPITCLLLTAGIEWQYRIKIDGLPLDITRDTLINRWPDLARQEYNIEIPKSSSTVSTRHVYLVRQKAEKLSRERIRAWHTQEFSAGYKVKCQLEYDRYEAEEIYSPDDDPESPLSPPPCPESQDERLIAIFERK
jgi:hypothetical protein